MNIIIIPGFTGYPEETTFQALDKNLQDSGHEVIKMAWPNIPDNLEKYSVSETLISARKILKDVNTADTIALGFSMGV